MQVVDDEQRRARLGTRHALATRVDTVEAVAAAMVGLHATDPATVYLATRARMPTFADTELEDALYDRRSLVRMLGMRRTMFVVPIDLAAVMDAACTKALAPPQRRRLIAMLEEQGVARDGARWLRRVERATMSALHERGEATASELVTMVPDLGKKLTFGEGKAWGAEVGVSTRVLFLLATDGVIVRGRPRGSWLSSQYRWVPTDTWLGAPLDQLDRGTASAELLRRWLFAFGPATVTDIRWWTGWTAAQTKATLASVDTAAVALDDGAPAFLLADDTEPLATPEPWVALLPSLDSTVMGWKERDWYLGEHASSLFDRNGNAGPTVWADGRVIGGWGQGADGSIAVALLERVDRATRARVRQEQTTLAECLGDIRIIPRFRTPLEKELKG
ncbi:MAG: winged helix DNA-binding domain-containing protein [Actinomycetota bacterium]